MKIIRLKAKLLKNNSKIKGYFYLKNGFAIFEDYNNRILKKIPVIRIMQTGFRKKWFFFDKKFYFKTSDGIPTVFYCCYPKKAMKILDKYIERFKLKRTQTILKTKI